jgi:hypothetical protein
VVVCFGALGAGAVVALGHGRSLPAPAGTPNDPIPANKDKPAGVEWIPHEYLSGKSLDPPDEYRAPSAFPELAVPEPAANDRRGYEKRQEQFAELCPRFTGTITLEIEPTDSPCRKLLKARLYHDAVHLAQVRKMKEIGRWVPQDLPAMLLTLGDAETTCLELWGGQPKELIPWLEELVVLAKELERFQRLRVWSGTIRPPSFASIAFHRLRIEATLWKAKNPK